MTQLQFKSNIKQPIFPFLSLKVFCKNSRTPFWGQAGKLGQCGRSMPTLTNIRPGQYLWVVSRIFVVCLEDICRRIRPEICLQVRIISHRLSANDHGTRQCQPFGEFYSQGCPRAVHASLLQSISQTWGKQKKIILGKFALNARVLVWFGNREEDKGHSWSLDGKTKLKRRGWGQRVFFPFPRNLNWTFWFDLLFSECIRSPHLVVWSPVSMCTVDSGQVHYGFSERVKR